MTELAVRAEQGVALSESLSIADLTRQVGTIQQAMEAVMKDGEHYGVIPGTQKPTLLKPGAEKLCLLFRLAPRVRTDKTWHPDGHLDVAAYVTLEHVPSGLIYAQDVEGFCSTRESRYRYRQGKRSCPSCNAQAIVRSTKKSAYFCISAEGGCGKRYGFRSEEGKALDAQETGKVENPDPADLYNTVVKMATKRALVAAVLVTTAASDIFTQDLEDFADLGEAPRRDTSSSASFSGLRETSSRSEDETSSASSRTRTRRRRSKPEETSETDSGEVDAPVGAAEDAEQTTIDGEATEEKDADADESPKITAADRRRLFAVARDAGLNEAELRATIQEITGQSSTAELTKAQLEEIVSAVREEKE